MSGRFRHTFILAAVAFGACLAAFGGWRFARASAPVSGPIVLISIDSLRADHLPSYGYRHVETPAIDALAKDAVVFERAYAHVPQTLPSHATMLTGRLPFETGVRDAAGYVLKSSERLLPAMLRDRGYATGGIVSSYLLRKETGIGQGFTFFDAEAPARAADPLQRDGVVSEQIAERWLEAAGTARAFLFLHLAEPHKPYAPPDRYASSVPYDGEIAYVDEIVGRLIRYLKAHQLYDRSTVILTADHGEGLGDHGEQEHGLFVYEEALRVPLIVKQAAGEGAGRRIKDVVQQIDLVPTILDLAKAPLPGGLRGRSLGPLLAGNGRTAARAVYGESYYGRLHFGWAGLATVTDGRYRFIEGTEPELYDLGTDPRQQVNLASKLPDVVATLRSHLQELRATAPDPQPDDGTISDEDRERLEALGYVGSLSSSTIESGDIDGDPASRYQVVERYRRAVDLAAAGHWDAALDAYRALLRTEPSFVDAWVRLGRTAARAERYEIAADAYKHALQLAPELSVARIGVASALLRRGRLDEAWRYAQQVVANATADDKTALSQAHEQLARIALARRETMVARTEAELAETADPRRPVRDYVDGRLAFDEHQYEDALGFFESALSRLEQAPRILLPDLRVYAADALRRLDRPAEAEHLLFEELKDFPWSGRARNSLIALYRATGRADEATALGR